MLVVQISATSVIVEWSQPSGGAAVTVYVVHYSHGDDNMTEDVPATSSSYIITNLTSCYSYTISVEATSEHVSGISERFTLIAGMYTVMQHKLCTCLLTSKFRCLVICECHS